MSKKSKEQRVGIGALNEIIKLEAKESITVQYPIGDKSIDIIVKKNIEKDDKVRFISDVVCGCFDGDIYQPYYKAELIRIAAFEYLTNIKVDADEDILFDLAAKTALFHFIEPFLPCLHEMELTIDDLIEYRKRNILCTQKKELDNIISTIDQYVERFAAIHDRLNEIDMSEAIDIVKKYAEKNERLLNE